MSDENDFKVRVRPIDNGWLVIGQGSQVFCSDESDVIAQVAIQAQQLYKEMALFDDGRGKLIFDRMAPEDLMKFAHKKGEQDVRSYAGDIVKVCERVAKAGCDCLTSSHGDEGHAPDCPAEAARRALSRYTNTFVSYEGKSMPKFYFDRWAKG